jgi:hypothetical protein
MSPGDLRIAYQPLRFRRMNDTGLIRISASTKSDLRKLADANERPMRVELDVWMKPILRRELSKLGATLSALEVGTLSELEADYETISELELGRRET